DVGRVHRARRAGGAEGALREPAVLGAREERAPVLELVDVARRLAREDLDRVLVAQVVGALDGVERVGLGAVLGGVAERSIDPALRRTGVRTRRVQLRDHHHVCARIVGSNGGAHAGAAGTHHQDVMLRDHRGWTLPKAPVSLRQMRGPAEATFDPASVNFWKFSRNMAASSAALRSYSAGS